MGEEKVRGWRPLGVEARQKNRWVRSFGAGSALRMIRIILILSVIRWAGPEGAEKLLLKREDGMEFCDNFRLHQRAARQAGEERFSDPMNSNIMIDWFLRASRRQGWRRERAILSSGKLFFSLSELNFSFLLRAARLKFDEETKSTVITRDYLSASLKQDASRSVIRSD